MRPAGKVSATVMVPVVAAVPVMLFGVNVKLPVPPTVNVPLLEVLVNCRSGARTVDITVFDVLFPAPVRPGSSGSVTPEGTIAIARLESVPVCGAVP